MTEPESIQRRLGGDGGSDLDGDVEELPRMTLIQHLEELRGRILRSLLALAIGFGVCFFFSKPIFRFLQRPILQYLPAGKKLVFLKVTDPFVLYMKVAALAGLFLVLPYVLFQIWRFIAPGLYRQEKRYSVPFIFFGSFFFLAGGVFAYYVAFPYAVQFLINVGEDFEPAITGPSYLSFLLTVILGMALMFELPVFIFALSAIGVVSPRSLLRNFRWAVLIIVAVAAVITPTPDIFTLERVRGADHRALSARRRRGGAGAGTEGRRERTLPHPRRGVDAGGRPSRRRRLARLGALGARRDAAAREEPVRPGRDRDPAGAGGGPGLDAVDQAGDLAVHAVDARGARVRRLPPLPGGLARPRRASARRQPGGAGAVRLERRDARRASKRWPTLYGALRLRCVAGPRAIDRAAGRTSRC